MIVTTLHEVEESLRHDRAGQESATKKSSCPRRGYGYTFKVRTRRPRKSAWVMTPISEGP